mgnify:CR=1 FL=1
MEVKRYFSDSPWEEKVQFCRALKADQQILVAGTAAISSEGTVGPYDASAQAQYIFEKIEKAVTTLGGSRETIIRTRMFLTRTEDADKVAEVHAAFFKGIYPVATMVFIDKLVSEDLVVEIEAEALAKE